ncbi:hypothetical protein [Streptomyces syringium]|uniref:hypothetical protein n=1 Tax=Streptomyces syringium TaxID=76729 RepID=UPI0034518E97
MPDLSARWVALGELPNGGFWGELTRFGGGYLQGWLPDGTIRLEWGDTPPSP